MTAVQNNAPAQNNAASGVSTVVASRPGVKITLSPAKIFDAMLAADAVRGTLQTFDSASTAVTPVLGVAHEGAVLLLMPQAAAAVSADAPAVTFTGTDNAGNLTFSVAEAPADLDVAQLLETAMVWKLLRQCYTGIDQTRADTYARLDSKLPALLGGRSGAAGVGSLSSRWF